MSDSIIMPRVEVGDVPFADVALNQWLTVPAPQYHADRTAVNQGALVEVNRSPAHFFNKWTSKPTQSESYEMRIGTFVHMALLEAELYGSAIVRPDFGDGRTKDAKERKTEWLKGCPPGSIIIDEDEKHVVEAMCANIIAVPFIAQLIKEARKEATAYFTDPETRILNRARLDGVTSDVIFDIKTMENATQDEVSKTIARNDYHFQSAHYLAAGDAVVAKPDHYQRYLFIASERTAPYECDFYWLSPSAIARGKAMRREALVRLRGCLDTNRWPGYVDNAATLETLRTVDLPPWAYASRVSSEDF